MSVVGLLLLALSGCGFFGGPAEAPPVLYTVQKGDTLFKIAKAHNCTVAELQSWNSLSGDLIEVGQVIEIRAGSGATDVAQVAKKKRRPKKTSGSTVSASSGTSERALVMPKGKACLAGPSLADVSEDEGFASNMGLSEADVRSSMNAFIGNTLRCVPDGTTPSGVITTEITVGCSGVVSSVEVTDDGHMPGEMVDCVRKTLGYTPFPPHDVPDGYTFVYPLRFTF